MASLGIRTAAENIPIETIAPAKTNLRILVLVDIVNELPGLGRGEVDVIGGPVPARDAYREPAGAGAESRLALGQRGQGAGFCEFRHDVRRVRNWQLHGNSR